MRPPYRRENDHWLIELRLEDPLQLFNTIDPNPFPQKDLDPAAEQFILDAVQDFHHREPIRLVIHLPDNKLSDTVRQRIQEAIRNYFTWRAVEEERKLERMLAEGRLALVVGMTFVFVCMLARSLLLKLEIGLSGEILAEGLLILGWVALWRPVDIFLYAWWPLQGMAKVYRRIAELPVDFRSHSAATPR